MVSFAASSPKQKAGLEKFLHHYFSTWSNEEMDSYGDCFAEGAVIQFLESGKLTTKPKDIFLAEQKVYQKALHGKETVESIEIRFEPVLARAVVAWKLALESKTQRGYDHFTPMEKEGKWKIVNLVVHSK